MLLLLRVQTQEDIWDLNQRNFNTKAIHWKIWLPMSSVLLRIWKKNISRKSPLSLQEEFLTAPTFIR